MPEDMPGHMQPSSCKSPCNSVRAPKTVSAPALCTSRSLQLSSKNCSYIVYTTHHGQLHAVAGVANTRADIAAYTAKTLNDPRTLDKRLVIAPPCNFATQPDLLRIWEGISGQKINTERISAEELEDQIQGETLVEGQPCQQATVVAFHGCQLIKYLSCRSSKRTAHCITHRHSHTLKP